MFSLLSVHTTIMFFIIVSAHNNHVSYYCQCTQQSCFSLLSVHTTIMLPLLSVHTTIMFLITVSAHDNYVAITVSAHNN